MNNSDDNTMDIGRLQQHILDLRQRGTGRSLRDDTKEALSYDEILTDLQTSLEELQVAEEELRAQNQELMESRLSLELQRQRYRDLFAFAPDPYLITDTMGKVLEANRAASIMFGIPLDFLLKKPITTYVADESRRQFRLKLATVKEIAEKEEWEIRLQPRHRLPFDVALTVSPIRNAAGEPTAVRWMIRDISAQKETSRQLTAFSAELEERVRQRTEELEASNREKDLSLQREREARAAAEEAQRRFRFLAEAGEIMSGSLNYEETLRTVAHMAVPRLGDWCFVDIVEEDDSIWRLAMAAPDAVRERFGKKMLSAYAPEESMQNRLLANAIATGRSEMVPEVTDDLLMVIAQDTLHLKLLRALSPKSVMVIPLVTRGRTLGAITLVATDRPNYTKDDLDLAEELAHRAALAVDNARLYRRCELEIEERAGIEEQLRRSESRFRRLVDSNLFGVTLARLDGSIIDANDASLEMLGYTREELKNGQMRWDTLTAPDYRHVSADITNRLLTSGISPTTQKEYLRRDGRRITVLIGATMLENSPDEMICFLLDITERARTEQHLQRQMRQLESIYRLSSSTARAGSLDEICQETMTGLMDALSVDRVSLLLFDADGVMRFHAWRGLSDGYRKAVEGHSPWSPDQVDPAPVRIDDVAADEGLGDLRDVVLAEGIRSLAFIPLAYDGRLLGKFMLYRNAPHHFTDQEIQVGQTAASHVAFAIGRKRIEEQLTASEARFRRLAGSNVIGIITAGFDGSVSQANDEFLRMVGYTREDLDAGKINWRAMTPKEHLPQDDEAIGRLRATGFCPPFEKEYFRKDGSRTPVLLGAAMLDEAQGETICFVLDISASQIAEKAMQEAKEAAEAANRAKDHFMAILSHELRTPLTPILSVAQAMQEDNRLPDEFRPMIDVICRNVELEATLIDDLLDLTRIVKGKLKLNFQTVDAHELIRSALAICKESIDGKRITIGLDLAAGRYTLHADPARIQQIIWNIINNAVRFTPVGGRIDIRTACAADGSLTVEIADTGVGITPEDLGRIFAAFEQGEQGGGNRHGGLGLGLAISRTLAEAHGGTVEAWSDGPGTGTTFRVTLPTIEPERGNAREPQGAITILVVDDHEDTRKVMELMLRHRGYRILTAPGVESAMRVAGTEKFDILLSDIKLADGSGLDLIRMLKAGRDIRSIAISGYRSDEDINACREAGFDTVMTKPVDSRQLRDAIESLVRGSAGATAIAN